MTSLVSSLSASIQVENAPKKAAGASNGHRFTSNLFAGVAAVSALAAIAAAAVLFIPAVAAVAAPVTGFLAAKLGGFFAAYSIPTWAVPAGLGVVAAASAVVSRALRPSV